ncbi:hypothetical protein [Hydrogenophilus thermoluteolus]|uniref:hypothetical protein n=1 Tax=Hydrogenophilus thermoluteolus TaxID=297 RepID=UPI003F671D68
MGQPEWAVDARFATNAARVSRDLFSLIAQACKQLTEWPSPIETAARPSTPTQI